MTVNELIKELQSCNEPNSDVFFERNYYIDMVTFGTGHTISIESSEASSYIIALEEQVEFLEKELEVLQRDYDDLEGEISELEDELENIEKE